MVTRHGCVEKHPARIPPTPEAAETKSVSPMYRSEGGWEVDRAGPFPEVPNGTSVIPAPAKVPDASWRVTPTPRRRPRARPISDRPAEVRVKYRSVPSPAPMCSRPVVAITVRPAVILVVTLHGWSEKQLAGTPPVPDRDTNIERPYSAMWAGVAFGLEVASTCPAEPSA